MALTALLLAAGGFVAWYVISSVWSWYRLRHIPGPKVGAFSYLWVAWKVIFARGMDYEHLNKYGSVVRVGPNYVLLDDPNDIRRLNGNRAQAARRDTWYTALKMEPDHNMLLTLLEPKSHDSLKARVSFGYSGRDNIDFDVAVDDQITHLVDVFRSRFVTRPGSSEVKHLDFAQFIRYFSLDTITKIAFGRAFGFMDYDGDMYNYTDEVENFIGLVALAADLPVLRRIFTTPILARWIAAKPTSLKGVGKLIGIAHEIVDERIEKNDVEAPDMIGSFIKHGLDIRDIKNETMLQIIAGSDTTATAIRSTMLYLMATPRVYYKLKEEIKQAVASGVSKPISVDQAKQLPYLQAVIFEGLRVRPPTTYGFYKVMPAGGEHVQGKFIPGGTAVGFNMPALMRREDIFGPNTQLFRPERFLEVGEEQRAEMVRNVELCFGYGRWMCAGKILALVELQKVYFELLREFDWQLVYPGKAWSEKAYTVYTQRDMWVSVTDAESS